MAAILCATSSFCPTSYAQEPGDSRVARVPASDRPEPAPKFSFLLFWKQNDAATQQVTAVLKASIEKRADRAEWTSVNVTDSANRALVDRYQVSRIPMPLVLCVAPNGAITGSFVRKLNDEAVEGAIVSRAATELVKGLQDKKIVIVHVQPDARAPLPVGAAELLADPDFQARTTTVNLVINDPAERPLLTSMEIKEAGFSDSLAVVVAPPGVYVGKFPAAVTKQQIIAALHAAGKCCNDPNCKHNQKGQK
jgi:hypothetical protein